MTVSKPDTPSGIGRAGTMNTLTIGSHYPATILHHLVEYDLPYRATLDRFGLSRTMPHDSRVRISMESSIPLYRHVTPLLGSPASGHLVRPSRPGTLPIGCASPLNA